MWRRFPARALGARLLLFVAFLAAIVSLRACLADEWRAGRERARAVVGEPGEPGESGAPASPEAAGAGRGAP
jgi:hypothetical protein